jgi:2-keto-3-deoxy-L-fuconate dehydrogenase
MAGALDRRIALVTGAASGIGEATARRLAEDGAAGLVLLDRDQAALDRLAGELTMAEVLPLAQDVGDDAAWAAAEAAVRDRFGRLDLAVANAGVAGGGPVAEMDFAEWRRVMSANLDGVFLTLRCALRLMGQGGAAVVVASAAAVKAEPGIGAYGASKAGAAHLARIAAKEAAAQGVRVNAILPGGVETPIWRGVDFFEDLVARKGGEAQAYAAMAAMGTPLKRYAKPEEIAGLIAFLLSDACGFVTGESFVCDGGYTL